MHGAEIQEGMVEYSQQMFERFNFPDSEPETPQIMDEGDMALTVPADDYSGSYVAMITESPSPPPAWAVEWNVADHLGFIPPSKLQMAQQHLSFALLLAPEDQGSQGLSLIPDLVEAVCTRAQRLRFPRVGAEVRFQVCNALQIDPTRNRLYDRIYVGQQGDPADLAHFQSLLAPGGCLVGPFSGEFLRVKRASEEHDDDFEITRLMRVAYAPLVRPGAGEDSMVLAPPPPPQPPVSPPKPTAARPPSVPLLTQPYGIGWSTTTTVSVGPTGVSAVFVTTTQVSAPKSGSTTVVQTGPD